jgi:hypothetical protein
MVTVTRFPFWFWQMKTEDNIVITNDSIIKDDKKYAIKSAPKALFLIAKYSIVVVAFMIIFTENDFSTQNNKIIQYLVSLAIAFIVILILKDDNNKKKYSFLIAPIIFVICIFVGIIYDVNSIAYIIKYLFVFYSGFQFFLDLQKTHYYLYNNEKLVANILVEE